MICFTAMSHHRESTRSTPQLELFGRCVSLLGCILVRLGLLEQSKPTQVFCGLWLGWAAAQKLPENYPKTTRKLTESNPKFWPKASRKLPTPAQENLGWLGLFEQCGNLICDLPKPIKRFPPPPHSVIRRRPSTEPRESSGHLSGSTCPPT